MKVKNILYLLAFVFIYSCNSSEDYNFYPKPLSGQKLVFPEKTYETFQSSCNYSFDIPKYAVMDTLSNDCNGNLMFTQFNATLYLTHINLDTNLMYNIEYSRKLAYDHSIKADAIEEAVINNPKNNTYGMQYKIIGDAASPYQFYVTDSSNNFLRGAFYFNTAPNYDSIKPTLDFLMVDFEKLIGTTNWDK
jgi:gliding motility-associated lipoprotein GldD